MALKTRKQLAAEYRRVHGALVEPRQGFGSLHKSLHLAYSIGRSHGFTDLGTYVNKPGDHGWDDLHRMAMAFDLGREDRFLNKGFAYIKAQKLFWFYVRNHQALEVEYVILGMKIWSRQRGFHRYTGDNSHMFHLHVSGSWANDL